MSSRFCLLVSIITASLVVPGAVTSVSAIATATTSAATSITQGGAVLNGSVNHDGSGYIAAFAVSPRADFSGSIFNYVGNPTNDQILIIRMQVGSGGGSGTNPQSFDLNSWTPSGGPTSLQPSTTYYYRLGIQTGADTPSCIFTMACYSWSSSETFTTRAAISASVASNDASLIGADIATITGVVTANDAAAQFRAEYSTSETFTNSSQTDAVTVAKGNSSTTVTRQLSGLSSETTYFYRLVASNIYGTATGPTRSFRTTPPIGISINDSANFTTNKEVNLSISWPVGATSMIVSNDGGFRGINAVSMPLNSNVKWVIDDSVEGLYTKIVYVRFIGPGIDASRSYSDDIIFDNRPPSVLSSTGEVAGSYVILELNAKDPESGLGDVEMKYGNKIVSTDYSPTVLMKASSLGISSASLSKNVRSQGISQVLFRISDKAGNKTSWITVGGKFVSKARLVKPRIIGKQPTTAKSIATFLNLSTTRSTKYVVTIAPRSKTVCRVSGTAVIGLKSGNCAVTVTARSSRGIVKKSTTLQVVR
jgi:hypothetical protein